MHFNLAEKTAGQQIGLLLAAIALLLPGCSGTASELSESTGRQVPLSIHPASPLQQNDTEAIQPDPDKVELSQLEEFLSSELSRLDTQRNASAAPGAGSEVFNLEATRVSDVNEQLNQIELSWTARLPGDYDGNGEVNGADLVPLAINWNRQVSYLPADEAGGVAHWPAGDRLDGSVGEINWTLAHIDGNADGLIGLADVTTIAQHWQERITGYRLFRHIPQLAKTELLPGPGGADADVTFLLKATDKGLRSFTYLDESSSPGQIEYYAVPWNAQTQTEGPAGNIAAYRVNALPSAVIDYTVSEGPEPYTVSFDASASSDWDGGIASYDWDLDGDGSFELENAGQSVQAEFMGGTSLVQLRVTDTDGASVLESIYLELEGVLNVSIETTASEAVVPHEFVLLPATDGSIAVESYKWYRSWNITPDFTSTEPEPFRLTVDTPGSFTVRLQVLGTDGLTREADILLRAFQPLAVEATVDTDSGFVPAQFSLRSQNVKGAGVMLRPLVNGEAVEDFGAASPWQVSIVQAGDYELSLEAVDKFGNTVFSDPINVEVYSRPDFDFSYSPDAGYSPLTVDYEISNLTDPDMLLEAIEISLPGGYKDPDTSPDNRSGSGEATSFPGMRSLLVKQILREPFDPLYDYHDIQFASMTIQFELSPEVHLGNEVRPEVEITAYTGDPAVTWLEWYLDGELLPQFYNEFAFSLDPLTGGTHELTARGHSSLGYKDFAKDFVVYDGDFEVAIIRNDNGAYQANLDEITSDLDDLGLSWQAFPYNDNILDDLAAHGHFVVLWYRGGPADDIEPRLETMWTTAEIDNYIAILEQGRPLMMMSQNNSKEADVLSADWFGGWELYYGTLMHGYALPEEEARHAWASSVVTDDGIGFGKGEYFQSAPQSFTADLGALSSREASKWRVESFNDIGSSGYRASLIEMPDGLQYCGIGLYEEGFHWEGVLYAVTGLTPTAEAQGLKLAHFSWGSQWAPYRNVGYWPQRNLSDYGSTRHWVVGYPWAAVNITESEPAGMTRADMLQNIIAWLKVDYDPQF